MSLISWYRNDSTESENRNARRAFETVLILAVKEPDTERYRHFSSQVNGLQENSNSSSMSKLVIVSSLRYVFGHKKSFFFKGQSICCNVLRCCFALCLRIKSNH